jgi:mRNA interferase RelE/StbE
LAWTVEWDDGALRDLRRLDHSAQSRILRFTRSRLHGCDDPRRIGTPLHGVKRGLWRYRVGDFRLICSIEDGQLVVLVVGVGHRREVYR